MSVALSNDRCPSPRFSILHLDSGREMRGGQWQVLYLMDELRKQGLPQTLLAPGGSPLLERAESAGIRAQPVSIAALWREVRSAALIHAHDARSHSIAAFVRRKPVVVSRRVAFPLKRTVLSRWKYGRAALYLAVSNYVRQQLIDSGVNAEKIVVVSDGVHLPDQRAGNGTTILALESSDPDKGGNLIRDAATLARVEVRFSQDLPLDLPRAAMFVYISESEGLGSAALLAQAHGVPVIASNLGGLPEAVENQVSGMLTENNPAEIARAIRRLLDDPVLAWRLGEAGRERVSHHFSAEQMAATTLGAYERVLACS